jgi:release factor glutamine methyltransferase
VAEIWTTLRVLDWTAQRFTERGVAGARLEAQILLAHVLQCTRTALYTGFDKPLAEDELAAFRELIRRRLAGEPVAYLTGETEFWSLPLAIDASVLVPRPDTETLVETALAIAPAATTILDLCTGSGAIAVALAHDLPAARVVATDISPAAAAIARTNAERNKLADRIDVRVGDLFGALTAGEQFDLIASNPPYVVTSVIATLSAEVRREPRLALDGGATGMDFYDRIAATAAQHLTPGGALVLEHGFDQADAVAARLTAAGFTDVTLVRDLGKQPRVTWARRSH